MYMGTPPSIVLFSACVIRLIYQGQPIDVSLTPRRYTSSHGLAERSTIHVWATRDSDTQQQGTPSVFRIWNDMRGGQAGTGRSNLFLILFFAVVLGYFAYWRVKFPHHFTPLASTLLGIFVSAAVMKLVMQFRPRGTERQEESSE